MKKLSIIGVDLAKQVFQLHGATADSEVVFRKKRRYMSLESLARVIDNPDIRLPAVAS